MMPPETVCPLRRLDAFINRGSDSAHVPEHEMDGGIAFAPCLRERCAWWNWTDKRKEEGECGILAIGAIAHWMSNGACKGGDDNRR